MGNSPHIFLPLCPELSESGHRQQRYQIAKSWTRTAVLVQFEEVTCSRFSGNQSFLLAGKPISSETTFRLHSVIVANASNLCERKSDI